VPNVAKLNSDEILVKILKCLESNSYDDRVAGAKALKELCESIDDDQLKHPNFAAVLESLMKLFRGKYFNDKEQINDCLNFLLVEDFIVDIDVVQNYLSICCEQIQKASGNYNGYKNSIIKAAGEVFKKPIRI